MDKLKIALIGAPNVGKSSLFNKLTNTKDALVVAKEGTTRDRQIGKFTYDEVIFELIDTAGIMDNSKRKHDIIINEANLQTEQAIAESDLVLFLFAVGLVPSDLEVKTLREVQKSEKPYLVALNKVDKDRSQAQAISDFAKFGDLIPISTKEGTGIRELEKAIYTKLAPFVVKGFEMEADPLKEKETSLCILGRPNVGKSTLTNRILGEHRVIVSEIAGTTIDAVKIPANIKGRDFILIDTAGVRRRSNIERDDLLEKFSMHKSFEAMERSDVILVVVSAKEGLVKQDLLLINRVIDSGKAFILLVNKWDELTEYDKNLFTASLDRFIKIKENFKIHYISAKHGTGVGDIFKIIEKLIKAGSLEVNNHKLFAVIEQLFESHQPPLIATKRAKVKFTRQIGQNPITFLLFGNTTLLALPDSYKRYLVNELRSYFKLSGLAIRLVFRASKNPYAPEKDIQEVRYMG